MSARACLALLVFAAGMAKGAERFDIAITVDDLTAHGPLPQGMSWTGIAQATLASLKRHGVPEAYGFVNAALIARHPGSEQVLARWREAGYPLGNHTYSHMNINAAPSLQAWLDDVKAGEPAVAARMHDGDWRYLRFPYLAAGDDRARREGALAWLGAQGYRIAEVTLSFNDWAYSEAYGRCLARGDQAAIAAMQARYLKEVDQEIARVKALSQRVYGRMIPQVLLTHMGAFGALTLSAVLDRLDAAGARWVGLAQAQSDPAYREAAGAPGQGTLIERHASAAGIPLSSLPEPVSLAGIDALCRQDPAGARPAQR